MFQNYVLNTRQFVIGENETPLYRYFIRRPNGEYWQLDSPDKDLNLVDLINLWDTVNDLEFSDNRWEKITKASMILWYLERTTPTYQIYFLKAIERELRLKETLHLFEAVEYICKSKTIYDSLRHILRSYIGAEIVNF